MRVTIGVGIAVVAAVAFSLPILHWFFRGEAISFVEPPGAEQELVASYLDEAAEQIVQGEGLDHDAYCLRVHKSREQYDDGCMLVRPALTARGRQCTPYRALNGGCYAVEIRQSLLLSPGIRNLLFVRAADMCYWRGAHSLDCTPPGDEYELVQRFEPTICVITLGASEEPSAPVIAIRRGRQVQDYSCREWERLVRERSRAQPRDCWLGAETPAPSGGTHWGCMRD